MDYMCRLCLSKKHLISLFGGKDRVRRECLLEYVKITTGLSIQHNDGQSSKLCYNCCIMSFNFYKFKCTAQENNLKMKRDVSTEESVNADFSQVESWLLGKRKHLVVPRTSKEEQINGCNADESTQTPCLKQTDKATQTNYKPTKKQIKLLSSHSESYDYFYRTEPTIKCEDPHLVAVKQERPSTPDKSQVKVALQQEQQKAHIPHSNPKKRKYRARKQLSKVKSTEKPTCEDAQKGHSLRVAFIPLTKLEDDKTLRLQLNPSKRSKRKSK